MGYDVYFLRDRTHSQSVLADFLYTGQDWMYRVPLVLYHISEFGTLGLVSIYLSTCGPSFLSNLVSALCRYVLLWIRRNWGVRYRLNMLTSYEDKHSTLRYRLRYRRRYSNGYLGIIPNHKYDDDRRRTASQSASQLRMLEDSSGYLCLHAYLMQWKTNMVVYLLN